MRRMRIVLMLCCAILISQQAGLGAARSETPAHSGLKAGKGAMVIHSNTLEADDRKGTVTFTGAVEARRDDFTVHCDKMVVHYHQSADRKGTEEVAAQIEKIVASGNVKIVRAEGGVATSDHAVYYQQDEKLVLTGKPVVKQNDSSVEGDQITLFLKENRSVVESSSEKKVRAVIFPNQEKQRGP